MDLDSRIRELRDQQVVAASRKARAEVELAVAERLRDDALAALRAEFGAENIDQARELLKAAEADLAAECRELESALAQAEGPE